MCCLSVLRFFFFFLIILLPPRSTRTDTLFPYTTLFRSRSVFGFLARAVRARRQRDADLPARNDLDAPPWRLCSRDADISGWLARRYAADRWARTDAWRRTPADADHPGRSEEHTSELQSLMRISYADFCLKKNTNTN